VHEFLSDRPVSKRSGEFGLWWIEVRNGKPIGLASPAWPQLGNIIPLGMTSSGSFYYVQKRNEDDIFSIQLTPGQTMDRNTSLRCSPHSSL